MVTLKVTGNLEVNTAKLTLEQLADIRKAQDYQAKAYDLVEKVIFSDVFKRNNSKPGEWCSGHSAISNFVYNHGQTKKEIIYE